MLKKNIYAFVVLLLVSCEDDKEESKQPSTDSPSARYELVFTSTWSSSTHPTNFPSSGAHFTTLIGMTHNDQISMWAVGKTVGTDAAEGMEGMAEDGTTSQIKSYVEAAIQKQQAKSVLSESGLGSSTGTTKFSFDVDQAHSLVTIVSMLAPSPDWFIGIHDVNLRKNNAWITDTTIDTRVYDAGTEKDDTAFSRNNTDQNPKKPISRLTDTNTDFSNGIPAIGTFKLRKI